jgi:hypothetical protein
MIKNINEAVAFVYSKDNELNELLERLNNHKATPSDEFFTFFIIVGLPIGLFCIVWIIIMAVKEIQIYRSKRR